MLKHANLTRTRVQQFHDQLVKPAVYGLTAPLSVGVFQCPDPIPYAQAIKQKYKPVEVGFRFGPRWSTAWFHVTGKIPAVMAGKSVVLGFKSETEALVYDGAAPAQGMEKNHDDYLLVKAAKGGEKIDVFIECGVNHFFGAGGGSRSDSRVPSNSLTEPGSAALFGHLHVCRLAVLHKTVRELAWDLEFLRSLEGKLPETAPRKRQLLHALNAAVNVLDAHDIPGTAAAARAILAPVLAAHAAASLGRCFAVGHAHIDTAWLWPLRETIRKSSRTFSTQISLMREYPDYVFQASQAQLYAFTKQHYPALFAEIKKMVKKGQWEAGGAMWVEADCNIPAGESLVRQILHGTNFWTKEFGAERGAQSYLWLPDVFGYSAALPQILKQAGLDYFVTQKISWNQFNKFPHHTFYWQGIDGTKVLTHFLPTDTYNGSNAPDELVKGAEGNLDADRAPLFLNAFGWGDGGGGPTRQHIEFARRAADCDGLPQTQLARVDTFLETLAEEASDLQTWVGELYLELHRGTYTTQARNKLANRQSEGLLHDAEFFCTLRPDAVKTYPVDKLDAAWKTVLLNQFHDIIPGSSITWVYEDSQDQYAQVRATTEDLITTAAAAWTGQMDTTSAKRPVVVFNTLSWQDSDLITIPASTPGVPHSLRDSTGRLISPLQRIDTPAGPAYLARAADVPSCGYAVFDLSADPAPLNPSEAAVGSVPQGSSLKAQASAAVLENRLLRAEFDQAGRITRLFDKLAHREVVDPAAPANQLMLYEDRPTSYGAWDIDLFYLEKGSPVTAPAQVRLVESGPLRATLEVTHTLGRASTLTQRISLAAESRRLDFATQVEWQEDYTFLRVLHPVNILAPRATYEIQFGHAERPTHFNTSWDFARFEVCAQKWADLSEGGPAGYGVALLNAGKYGHSCHGSTLGLSLLRSPDNPDPKADRGPQSFTYALLPHAGDFRDPVGGSQAGSVIQQAYRLNTPLHALPASSHPGPLPPRHSAISCSAPNVIVETVKQAENSSDLIVRLYECHGRRNDATLTFNFPYAAVTPVDLLERPTDLYSARVESRTVHLSVTPFALRTLAIQR